MPIKEFPHVRRLVYRFGRYVGAARTEQPAHEFLVGRAELQARVVDSLECNPERGAYLVTGARGAGKTSFLRSAIEEYTDDVHGRFIGGQFGKTVFWDLLGFLVAAAAICVITVLWSEAVAAFLRPEPGSPIRFALPELLITLAGLTVFGFPAIHAFEVLRGIGASTTHRPIRPGVIAGIVAALIYFGVLWVSTTGVGQQVPTAIYSGALVTYILLGAALTEISALSGYRWRYRLVVIHVIGIAASFVWIVWLSRLLEASATGSNETTVSSASQHAVAVVCLQLSAAYCALRWCRTEHSPVDLLTRLAAQTSAIESREEVEYVWYLVGAGLLFAGSLFYVWYVLGLDQRHAQWFVWAGFVLGLALLLTGLVAARTRRRPQAPQQPADGSTVGGLWDPPLLRPRLILFAKALGLTLFSVQLLVRGFVERFGASLPWSDAAAAGELPPGFRVGDVPWIVASIALLVVVFLLEYEWVVKQYSHLRHGVPFTQRPLDVHPPPHKAGMAPAIVRERMEQMQRLEIAGVLARQTFSWQLMARWRPVHVVNVNLGLENLSHTNVLYSMIGGLRDQYAARFVALTSFASVTWLVVGATWAVALAPKLADVAFHGLALQAGPAPDNHDLCPEILDGPRAPRRLGAWLVCTLPGGEVVAQALAYPIQRPLGVSDNEFLRFVLPASSLPPHRQQISDADPGDERVFRLYHLVFVLGTLLIALRIHLRHAPFPYRQNVRRMDKLLNRLRGTTRESFGPRRAQIGPWAFELPGNERREEVEVTPEDPRSLERELIEILAALQNNALRLPGGTGQQISMPAPEVIFIFDELDKLGLGDHVSLAGRGVEAIGKLADAERQRSIRIHVLLGELKNVLAHAPARFFFVGAENMEAEWLADENDRRPLLTSIFDAHFHVPSLLSDKGQRATHLSVSSRSNTELHRWDARIAEAVYAILDRSHQQYQMWLEAHFALPFMLWVPERRLSRIRRAAGSLPRPDEVFSDAWFELGDGGLGNVDEVDAELVRRDVLQYLAYRSRGLPKRLIGLLDELVRPLSNVQGSSNIREKGDSTHFLTLGEAEQNRIQLVATVYRQLVYRFERRLHRRDDRLVLGLFYFTDFLMKFHGRAFNWNHLEHVDEAIHIYRAPDVRAVIQELVASWSERFLHPILNGMYDFRFRSDFACEIDYLSRIDDAESAALNFTLDESLALKTEYEGLLVRMGEHATHDALAGLGELHDFDEEYEMARHYFQRAIRVLDGEFERATGGVRAAPSWVSQKGAPSRSVIVDIPGPSNDALGRAWSRSSRDGDDAIRAFVTWGLARLRLMLQIGMTYERARNYERALAMYRDARSHASHVLDACIDAYLAGVRDVHDDRRDIAKHINLLFQPVFAEAWVQEKLSGGVDTSLHEVERELVRLRAKLPFVRIPIAAREPASSPTGGLDANFALIMAELSNKAGDLCFYKGRQYPSYHRMNGADDEHKPNDECLGYLIRAHTHYAMCLHEARSYNVYRAKSSEKKLGTSTQFGTRWPDFVHRTVAGGLNDIEEATIARVSVTGLFQQLADFRTAGSHPFRCARIADELHSVSDIIRKWVGGASEDAPLELAGVSLGTVEQWFGAPACPDPRAPGVVDIEWHSHNHLQRCLFSVAIANASIGTYSSGGYVEDAAGETIHLVENIALQLHWLVLGMIRAGAGDDSELFPWSNRQDGSLPFHAEDLHTAAGTLQYAVVLASVAAHVARRGGALYRESRLVTHMDPPPYQVGSLIPVELLRATLDVLLSLSQVYRLSSEKAVLEPLLVELHGCVCEWTGGDRVLDPKEIPAAVRDELDRLIKRHAFPAICRVRALALHVVDLGRRWPEEPDERKEYRKLLLTCARDLASRVERVDAPQHTSPGYVGCALALAWLWLDRDRRHESPGATYLEPDHEADAIRAEALRYLNRSVETCTMQRSYYETIAGMYYLFDDQNDRRIHTNQAHEFASIDLTAYLRRLLLYNGPAASAMGVV